MQCCNLADKTKPMAASKRMSHLPVPVEVDEVGGGEHEPPLPPVGGPKATLVLRPLHHERLPQDLIVCTGTRGGSQREGGTGTRGGESKRGGTGTRGGESERGGHRYKGGESKRGGTGTRGGESERGGHRHKGGESKRGALPGGEGGLYL